MKLQALTIPLDIFLSASYDSIGSSAYFLSSTDAAEVEPVETELTPFIIIIMASAASEPWPDVLWMGALTGPFLPARPRVETGKLVRTAGAEARCSISSRRSEAGCCAICREAMGIAGAGAATPRLRPRILTLPPVATLVVAPRKMAPGAGAPGCLGICASDILRMGMP